MLPYVKIDFKNGSLGGVEPMDDGVTLAIIPGLNLEENIDCLTYEDFVDKADTESTKVAAFFTEAGGKCRLIVSSAEPTEANIKALLSDYAGDIRHVVIDGATSAQLNTLQAVGEWAAAQLYAPVMFFVSVAGVTPKTLGLNRVAVVDTVTNAQENGVALLWYVAGRAAQLPVQRSVARAKDGALTATEWYYTEGSGANATVKLVNNLYAEPKHNSGYITVRTFQGKAGYYISDDLMAAEASDDYHLIPRRRTIDKAYRIAYKTLVEYIGDEIPVTADGTIPTAICKEIENNVERNIYSLMTVEGNLGVDTSNPNDKGVTCYVDPKQNVVATSRIDITLKVKPYGYTKYIEVKLGFDTNA